MRLVAFLLCLLSLAPLCAESPAKVAEKAAPWVELITENPSDIFKSKLDNWVLADEVSVDEKNPKKLTHKPGKGILVNGIKGNARDLVTKKPHGDIELEMEFVIPKGSNSGVKFHSVYEIQICDSFGKTKELSGDDCGGIYPRAEFKPRYTHIDKGIAPSKNACKAPGEWQKLTAIFLAPRFDAEGKKTTNAKLVKVTLNGETIHENLELKTPTGHNWTRKEVAEAPLFFQGDHGPVAFRNIRIRPYSAK
jgi:hypothetical protein